MSEFGNRTLDDIWLTKGCPKNISIVQQQLECDGNLRIARYGHPLAKGYDGVNMRGNMAVQHYTGSFANTLMSTLPQLRNMKSHINITPSHSSPPSQPPPPTQRLSYADSVKQFRYQAQPGSAQQQQRVPRYVQTTEPLYSVHTQNRFATLQSGN